MGCDYALLRNTLVSATFSAEWWKGTIQDQSIRRAAMSFAGTPRWVKQGCPVALVQRADADGTTSGNKAALVDVTGDFTVEWRGTPLVAGAGVDVLLSQVEAGAGGFVFAWDAVNTVYVLTLYTAAGAVARSLSTPAASAVPNADQHVILTSSAGGTAGSSWINGIPRVVTLGGAGVAANIVADSPIVAGGGGVGTATSLFGRVYPSALSDAAKSALVCASRSLVTG